MIPRVGTALPIDGSFGEVIKGTQTMLRAFGWDLGKFYDDKMRRRSFTDEYLDLAAGDVWPASPPTRTLRLLGHVGDLYDPSTTDLLSNEYGAIAVKAVERWREFLPHGGNVHLSRVGQAVALVKGTWTYLGSLDDWSADDLDEVV